MATAGRSHDLSPKRMLEQPAAWVYRHRPIFPVLSTYIGHETPHYCRAPYPSPSSHPSRWAPPPIFPPHLPSFDRPKIEWAGAFPKCRIWKGRASEEVHPARRLNDFPRHLLETDSTPTRNSEDFLRFRHIRNGRSGLVDPSGTISRHIRNSCLDISGTKPRSFGNGACRPTRANRPVSGRSDPLNFLTYSLNPLTFPLKYSFLNREGGGLTIGEVLLNGQPFSSLFLILFLRKTGIALKIALKACWRGSPIGR